MHSTNSEERGQGLVEYALILVLVAIVVIGILTLLGPQVRDVYNQINWALGGGGVIESATAVRTGNDTGNDVEVTVTVSAETDLTVRDLQSGQSTTLTCSGTCTTMFTSVGFNAGTITISTDGGYASVNYSVKK
jgi:pilus assembly protein Flp/PilA